MHIDFFVIPVHGGEDESARLNSLLNSVRVLCVDREFVSDGTNSFWSICVQHQSPGQRPAGIGKKPPVDYKEVLSPEAFAIFARLRELRKSIAAEEAIPPYSIFTNEQLAQMVQRNVQTAAALQEIPGIGEARVSKYGSRFLPLIIAEPRHTNGAA